MIRFGRAICGDLAQAERREWWLSNGLGGYAGGTIAGSLTRRYHGLLITPLEGELDRQLLFARAEPVLEIAGRHFPLSCNRWQSGAIAPRGYLHIESFRLDGQLPVWVYAVAGVRLEQRIFMEQGEAATWVLFRLLDPLPEWSNPESSIIKLHLHLLVNRRDHHGQMASDGIAPDVKALSDGSLQVGYADDTRLYIQLSDGALRPEYHWIDDLLLPLERERGLPDRDNHLAVARVSITLRHGGWHGLRAGLRALETIDPAEALGCERRRQADFSTGMGATTPGWIDTLATRAGSFVFRRPLAQGGEGESVIAGYPWFGDWGRDTMIALPGLTLASGQLPLALRILKTWAGYVDRGMIPNRFVESATPPEYNSVDASLWFVLAWLAYLRAGGKDAELRKVLPALEQIIQAYTQGTRYRIHLDDASGLLHIGEADTQLTWMDARVNGVAVTPRSGKPVEVNALWYNALRAMQSFCARLGEDGSHHEALAERCRHGFRRYLRPEGGLYDVLDSPHGDDASVRPNQLFALSLPWPLLDDAAASRVLDEVREHLYTSHGLRSLSPQDPAYHGIYRGGVEQRDAAYHNGPVWGWLLGHYVMAHFRLHRDAEAARALLEPVRDQLFDAGLGSLGEIFDGDPPHEPRGAPSQAWSVATALEAWWLIEGDKITHGEQ